MDLKLLKKEIEQGLKSNKTMSFFCKCAISYKGRAEAELEEGQRLIIIKSDNTILVHQPEGSNPVNYMKNDTSIKITEIEQGLFIQTYNSKYKDYLDIIILEAQNFTSAKLEDGKKLVLVGNEKDMSDMIKNNPEVISSDFKPLNREEHTKFGFIDVFGHDGKGNIVVIECKRYTAGLMAVQQLRRYVEKIMELKGLPKEKVKGILAAPGIAKNAEEMLKKWKYTFKEINPPRKLEKTKDQKQIMDF